MIVGTAPNQSRPAVIGRGPGQISELRVYSGALTHEEVRSLYHNPGNITSLGLKENYLELADLQSQLKNQADRKIVLYAQNVAPTSVDFGDIWLDTDGSGYPSYNNIYRYEDANGGSSGTLAWRVASDSAVGRAYIDAAIAEGIGRGKTTFTSGPSEPANPVEGDMWLDTGVDPHKWFVRTAGGAWQKSTSFEDGATVGMTAAEESRLDIVEGNADAGVAGRERIAEQLGYTDYDSMAADIKASGKLIDGQGLLETTLLDADAIIAQVAVIAEGFIEKLFANKITFSEEFKSQNYEAGSKGVKFDPVVDEYEFNGTVNATDGQFSGELKGATGDFSGEITGGSIGIAGTRSFSVDENGSLDSSFASISFAKIRNLIYGEQVSVLSYFTERLFEVTIPDASFVGSIITGEVFDLAVSHRVLLRIQIFTSSSSKAAAVIRKYELLTASGNAEVIGSFESPGSSFSQLIIEFEPGLYNIIAGQTSALNNAPLEVSAVSPSNFIHLKFDNYMSTGSDGASFSNGVSVSNGQYVRVDREGYSLFDR